MHLGAEGGQDAFPAGPDIGMNQGGGRELLVRAEVGSFPELRTRHRPPLPSSANDVSQGGLPDSVGTRGPRDLVAGEGLSWRLEAKGSGGGGTSKTCITSSAAEVSRPGVSCHRGAGPPLHQPDWVSDTPEWRGLDDREARLQGQTDRQPSPGVGDRD